MIMTQVATQQCWTFYSKVQKYVDSSSVNNALTAAGEDCILASLERPSHYRLYYNTGFSGRKWGLAPRKGSISVENRAFKYLHAVGCCVDKESDTVLLD